LCGLTVSLCAAAVLVGAVLAPARAAGPSLSGAGSTFPGPFFAEAFPAYDAAYGASVSYQLIGSGGGILAFTQKRVDFGVTDVPLDPTSELPAAVVAGGSILQVPLTIDGVSVAYNIPGVKSGLRLTGPVLARIFLGEIRKWNDREIKALNPTVRLPAHNIVVAYRSDGSGASRAFASYLSRVSAQWRHVIGVDKLPGWATSSGIGHTGSAQEIQSTPDSIGYLELRYAAQNHMTQAALLNKAGHFRTASVTTVAAAAAHSGPAAATDSSIINAPGRNVYPIAFYSWVLVFQHPGDPSKAAALKKLFLWTATSGQSYAAGQGYVALPKSIQKLDIALLRDMR
jgi:phosphate transport system substrate-binding protein